MTQAVAIIVAVLNAVGPAIVELLIKAFASPDLNDNGKAAIEALGLDLKKDEANVDAIQPLPVPGEAPPDPEPTPRER